MLNRYFHITHVFADRFHCYTARSLSMPTPTLNHSPTLAGIATSIECLAHYINSFSILSIILTRRTLFINTTPHHTYINTHIHIPTFTHIHISLHTLYLHTAPLTNPSAIHQQISFYRSKDNQPQLQWRQHSLPHPHPVLTPETGSAANVSSPSNLLPKPSSADFFFFSKAASLLIRGPDAMSAGM